MFADFIKTAVKIAAIVAGIAIIVAIIGGITIPVVDLGVFSEGVARGKAILMYYCGDFYSLFEIAIGLLVVRFTVIPVTRLALISLRATIKANT